MPSLNFQKQFVPLIESGEKRQTIRPLRKNPIKVDDPLFLFTGLRTNKCRRLFPPSPYFMYGKKYVTIPGTGELKLEDVPFVICRCAEKIRLNNGVVWVGDVNFKKPGSIDISKQCLADMKLYEFSKADGFANSDEMFNFFRNQYGLPFEGVLIKW